MHIIHGRGDVNRKVVSKKLLNESCSDRWKKIIMFFRYSQVHKTLAKN